MSLEARMMRIAAVVLALFLSGCAGTPPKSECGKESCVPGTTSAPSTSPTAIPPIDFPITTPKVVQFEGCEAGIGAPTVPIEKAQAVVPDDFDIAYAFNLVPRTAAVQVIGITCARVVANSTVLQDVSWFYVQVLVSPKNESWRGDGVNRYLLDSWFSAPELVEWFQSARIPAEAASFHRESVPPGSAVRTEAWSVDGPSCNVATQFNGSGQTLQTSDDVFYTWVGPKPYQRIEIFQGWTLDARYISAAPLHIEGQCASQRVLDGTPAQASEYNPQYNATLTITGKLFG